MKSSGLLILFSGMIAADPRQGGATWAVLQYVLGLRRLGHDVYFVEPLKPEARRPTGASLAASENAAYFRAVMAEFGLSDRSALLLEGTTQTEGLPYARLAELAGRADLLFNVSGMLADPALVEPVPVRAYLDLDPAFVQMWHAVQGVDMGFDRHTQFVTVGQAIGEPGCRVPTCGRTWLKTLPPVVLEHWPQVGPDGPRTWDAWTTVANWRGYGSIEHGGMLYGQKAHSLRRLVDLPRLTAESLAPAIAIHPGETKDWKSLADNGWRVLDPGDVASSPARYRSFVQGSKGEFGLAKSGYVDSRCGWFSDRSACYLASGRPVVAQDTGFPQFISTGEGLLAFTTAADAAAAVETVGRDYARHSRAARALAAEHLDSDRVLGRLLRRIGAAS